MGSCSLRPRLFGVPVPGKYGPGPFPPPELLEGGWGAWCGVRPPVPALDRSRPRMLLLMVLLDLCDPSSYVLSLWVKGDGGGGFHREFGACPEQGARWAGDPVPALSSALLLLLTARLRKASPQRLLQFVFTAPPGAHHPGPDS